MEPDPSITIKEIARLSGVSIGTVDRALHDRPGISSDTRQKVIECARSKGFRPSLRGYALVKGHLPFVGAVIPVGRLGLENEVEVLLGARQELVRNQHLLMIVPAEEEYEEAIKDLEFAGCKAILCFPQGVTLPATRQAQLISVIHHIDNPAVVSITANEHRTGSTALEYLYSKGHRSVLYLDSGYPFSAQIDRARGFLQAAESRGVLMERTLDPAALPTLIRQRSATAVFCHNDYLALSAIRELDSNDISVPRDVSVMGVDDMKILGFIRPDLTTMRYDFRELGIQAARKALSIIHATSYESTVPDLLVVERGTVAAIEAKA